VSAEVSALDFKTMVKEGEVLAALHKNVVVKIPLTWDGLQACKILTDQDIPVNVTLCFSVNQALLAAKAGATFISPFIGRLDDIHLNGMQLIKDIVLLYSTHFFDTEILAASIRTVNHVQDAALAGANIATIPAKILKSLVEHPLTQKGLDTFVSDWQNTGQSIL
jgi:transaldolase